MSNISAAEDDQFVEFLNGERIELGQAVGDVAEEAIKRAQIRRTIEDHLQKQLELYPRGIKVLSLFFIDKVERYRLYAPVRSGEYAQMFEEEYADAVKKWRSRYEKAGVPLDDDPTAVHTGYFARDGKKRFKNSTAAASTAADVETFSLIMEEKETLLSFPATTDTEEERAKKRVQFIWSHSALKEGWDNPNVFQICTLVETKDTMTKRQKVGRGLRLCVDQNGERCYDEDVNVLTVVANESYDTFARQLQSELEKDGVRFGIITPETFTAVTSEKGGIEERIGYAGSKAIFDSFQQAGLIDKKGNVSPELKLAAERGAVELPAEFEGVKQQVEALIVHKAQKLQIKDKSNEVTVELRKDVSEDPAFQELWERIRKRTRFEVDVDSDKLVSDAIESVRGMPRVEAPQVLSTRADLSVDDTGVGAEATATSIVQTGGRRVYDLPDPIAELQDAVGLTRATIKRILEGCGRFDEFAVNAGTLFTYLDPALASAEPLPSTSNRIEGGVNA